MRTLTVTEEQYDMILDGLAALESRLNANGETVSESMKIKYKYGVAGIDDRSMIANLKRRADAVHRYQMELFRGEGDA